MPTLNFNCSAGCGITTIGIGAATPKRHYDNFTGTAPTVETAIAHVAGGRSYRWNTVGAPEARWMDFVAFSSDVAVARIAFRFETLPSADVTIAAWALSAGNQQALRYRLATTDVCGEIGTLQRTAGFVVTTGVWYIADLFAYSGTPRTITVQITEANGTVTKLGSATSAAAAGTITDFRTGIGTLNEAVEADLYITSIAHSLVSGDYPIGAGFGIALRPRADGTHNFSASTDFEYDDVTGISPSATDTWQSIDDLLDNITDFLAIPGAAAGEYLEWLLDPLPAGVSRINGVEVVSAHHASGTINNTQTMRLVDGGSESDVFTDADFSFTTIAYNTQQMTAPSGGLWTPAKLNALKVRWGASWTVPIIVTVPYLNAFVLEVDYDLRAPLAQTAIMPIGTWSCL